MHLIQHESYVAGIDDDARAELLRNAVQDRQARLVSWRERAMGGGASGSELYTVWGEAASGGSVVPWMFILKMFNHEGEGWQESSTDPVAWDFWKREWLVYQAAWIHELQEGLVAPRCFGSGELGETAVWVAMEDLSSADRRPWSPGSFASAARHLGEFNGRFLDDGRAPADRWLSRDWIQGWTERAEPCDNLISAEVVTADGRLLVANDRENEDLFWALRGGSGNFGVVTSFEFRLSPVKDIYGGPISFVLDRAGDVLRFFREFIVDAPEQLGGFPAFQIAPPLPFIPENRHGEPFVAIVACWAGPLDDGERAVQPFRDVAPIVAELVGPMPYPALNSAFDGLVPPGLQHYWKANFNKELTDAAIEGHLQHAPRLPAVNSTVHLYPINGACHRIGPDETAFAYRDATFATVIAGMWPDPAQNEANIQWVRDYYQATAPYSEAGGYINFMSEDDQDRIEANYRDNYDRLVETKRKYDPDNLFHVNQNITP